MSTKQGSFRHKELALLHEPSYHFHFALAVRVVAHRQIEPGGFFHDAALMRETFKTSLAVVTPHAAMSNTAKGHA